MGAIDRIATAEVFQAGSVYSNTAQYRSVKRSLNDVADRLQALIGNMGIEGATALAIDDALTELVSRLRERSDNVDQLADARNTATQGGTTAGSTSQSIQPQADQARAMITNPDPMIATQGEMLYARLETQANVALRALDAQTDQAISELPTVFPDEAPVSQGGGRHAANSRAGAANVSSASGYAPKVTHSATRWMPEASTGEAGLIGPGVRAALNPLSQATDSVAVDSQAAVRPGAIASEVGQPANSGFPTPREGMTIAPNDGTIAAANVPFTATEGFGAAGVAKAAAGAAALPAMAKAVARAQAAISARGAAGASPRGGAAPARGASSRGGAVPRGAGAPTARSGAATRTSSASSRTSITPRAGQGAATKAGTPARGASARSSSVRAGAPASPGRSAAARGTGAARGSGVTARRTASQASGAARAASTRGGVTAPRQGAGRAAGSGMMGRPVTGRTGRERSEKQGYETFAAAELQEETAVTFIEAGQRDAGE